MSNDPKSARGSQKIRDDHALATGRIAWTWNELHEELAVIFGYPFHYEDYELAGQRVRKFIRRRLVRRSETDLNFRFQ